MFHLLDIEGIYIVYLKLCCNMNLHFYIYFIYVLLLMTSNWYYCNTCPCILFIYLSFNNIMFYLTMLLLFYSIYNKERPITERMNKYTVTALVSIILSSLKFIFSSEQYSFTPPLSCGWNRLCRHVDGALFAGENHPPQLWELSGSSEDYSSGTDAQGKSVFSRELHHTF